MISTLTISIFTYIAYKIANKILAIQIHIKYLILCGCCAFLINSIFPRIFVGFAGVTGTLGIIIIFAILSSYFIAFYYDNAMKKAALENTLTTASVEIPETLQTDENVGIETTTHLKDRVEIPANLDDLSELVGKEYFYPVQYKEHNQHIPYNSESILENRVNIIENREVSTESVSKKYFYPVLLENDNTHHQQKPGVLQINTVDLDNKAEVFTNFMNFKKHKSILMTSLFSRRNMTENANDLKFNLLDGDVSQQPTIFPDNLLLESVNSEAIDEDCFSSSKDLDGLMDFAFSQKEQRNFLQALRAFRQALLLYPDSEVAPLLIVEIGTILKNLGSYNEAIKIFIEGRTLVGVINNSALEQEFINNIAYLRVVKNILIQNSLKFIPFNLIPESTIKEINTEFNEWRNQS